jgi:hypothetical protein
MIKRESFGFGMFDDITDFEIKYFGPLPMGNDILCTCEYRSGNSSGSKMVIVHNTAIVQKIRELNLDKLGIN